MHSRGLFSFVLVLVFLLAALELGGIGAESGRQTGTAMRYALEMEQAGLVRNEIERNFDEVIGGALARGVAAGNLDAELLKIEISDAVVVFAMEEELIHNRNPSVMFGIVRKTGKGYTGMLETGGTGLSAEELRSLFSVLVLNISEGVFVAEFVFTGGLLRDRALGAEIEFDGYAQLFVVPVGYTRRVVVVV